MKITTVKKGDKCVSCNKGVLKPIVYGMPTQEDFESDKYVLGGCIVSGDDPKFACGECGASYWSDGRYEAGDLLDE